MKKLWILLFVFLCLTACEKYRVVEMEDGRFVIQTRFQHPYDWCWDNSFSYRGFTKTEMCLRVEEMKRLDEEARRANTIKRVVDCKEIVR